MTERTTRVDNGELIALSRLMGDPARFRLLADLIAERFTPSKTADVAGGKGLLRSQLSTRGFSNVTTIDHRKRLAKGRPGQHYGLFDWRTSEDYDLIVGMHPDEASDHIVLYAAERRVPFVLCPCCVKPSAAPLSFEYLSNSRSQPQWFTHLSALAQARRMIVEWLYLPMRGANLVLIGTPI